MAASRSIPPMVREGRARRTFSAPSLSIQSKAVRTGLVVVEDLKDGLQKPRLLDVTLVGRDGVSILAPKFILACRSPVLERCFYPKKNEQHENQKTTTPSVLRLDYDSVVIQAMVEYCFSDEVDISTSSSSSSLSSTLSDDDENNGNNHDDHIVTRRLVQLAQLAVELELLGLQDKASRKVRGLVQQYPDLAAVVYEEATPHSALANYAWQLICDDPEATLLNHPHDMTNGDNHHQTKNNRREPGIAHVSPERLEMILQDPTMECEEFTAFRILWIWMVTAGQTTTTTTIIVDKARNHEIAQRLAQQYILLKDIEPSILMTTIRQSGWFPDDQLFQAMSEQALQAERNGMSFSNYRGPSNVDRILVRGAGHVDLNGMYHRESLPKKQRHGEHPHQTLLYRKQVAERGENEFGLYFARNQWNLASLLDLSLVYYTCAVTEAYLTTTMAFKIPCTGWRTTSNGVNPPPMLQLLPARNHHRTPSQQHGPNGARSSRAIASIAPERRLTEHDLLETHIRTLCGEDEEQEHD